MNGRPLGRLWVHQIQFETEGRNGCPKSTYTNLRLLDSQAEYLTAYRDAIRDLSRGNGALGESEQSELVRRMETLVSGGKLSFMIGLSANAVASELASEAVETRRTAR